MYICIYTHIYQHIYTFKILHLIIYNIRIHIYSFLLNSSKVTILRLLHALSHWIFRTTLWSRHCYYSHFIDEELRGQATLSKPHPVFLSPHPSSWFWLLSWNDSKSSQNNPHSLTPEMSTNVLKDRVELHFTHMNVVLARKFVRWPRLREEREGW